MPVNSPLAAAVLPSGRRPVSFRVLGRAVVLAVAVACLSTATAVAQTYDLLKVFSSDGLRPHAGLIQGTDGNLYGTTYSGGANNDGTIFKISADGSTFTRLHSFTGSGGAFPVAALIQATDGNLYGTTRNGGANGDNGTVFRIDSSGNLTTLHSFAFSDGAAPFGALTQATDGNLYGTTFGGGANSNGTIFKISTDGSTFTTLHSFASTDGAFPQAGLVQATDGNLYGTTAYGGANNYGTIFKMDTSGSTFATLHSFVSSDGAFAYAGLVQATDGNLYGTATLGGASGYGTIFKIDTSGTTFTTLHSLAIGDGAYPYGGVIQGADGNLYGTAAAGGANGYYGTIFKIDTNGTTFTTLHSFTGSDGSYSYARPTQGSDGNLYGTTYFGGVNNYGTIFKMDTNGSTFTTLHIFVYSDGATPYAGLMHATDGSLYGTTYSGSMSGYGTIFKMDTSGSTFTTLHTFVNSDGANPYTGLIQGLDGNLYGTTPGGGATIYGTIFKIDTNGSTFTTLHDFVNSDGAYPSGLMQATDGNLYGTTYSGGASGLYGTIFKIDTGGTTFTTLYSFAGSDGANPQGSLIQGADGNLYGTAANGGANGYPGYGTIFKIDTNGTTLTTLHSFASSDGAYPYAGLIQGADGNLYGTAAYGGSNSCYGGCGTIFKIDTSGSTFTTLHSFASNDGASPQAGLIQGADGNLYGTTAYGGSNSCSGGCGTIFRIDTNGSTLTTLYSLVYTDGVSPHAGLIQGAGGNLYGTASTGGPAGGGVVFRVFSCSFNDVPPTDPFHTFICTIARDGITAGCGGNNYCPDSPVRRAEMAVFLLKAEHGPSYVPPPATGTVFADVPANAFAADWIEQLSTEGITAGCSANPLLYCPTAAVTRAQMAVFLLRAEHGPGYAPPSCAGIFLDVACTPTPVFAANWIEQLHAEGVTAGCSTSPLLYCPDNPNTRGQMAVFLVMTFGL